MGYSRLFHYLHTFIRVASVKKYDILLYSLICCIINGKGKMDMDIQVISKQSFSVIGKEGQGMAASSQEWIPPLWTEANAHFAEIAGLVKYDEAGRIAGLWGAMSDIDNTFKPWDHQGKYLAGCEVPDAAIPPTGWTKWTIPAFSYIVATCSQDQYAETFSYVLKEFFPKNNYSLAGAVQEFYSEPGNSDRIALYFPIE